MGKTDRKEQGKRYRRLVRVVMICLIGLLLSACGEVVSVEDPLNGDGVNRLMLSWEAPSVNEDGTPLTDLAGYKLHYGNQPGQYSQVVNVGNFTSAELDNLLEGTWYVVVTAYDQYGNESSFSNEVNYTFL